MIITNLPDLAGDEGILAEIPNIEVKSIDFRLFLTNKRLILVEDAQREKPPVVVPLQVIRSIASGTNFSDDPVLKLSLSAPDGSQKKMVLSFTQEFSGIRDKERDQLKKVLEGVVSEYQMTVKAAPKPFPGQSAAGHYSVQQPANDSGAIITAANVVVKSQEYTVSLTNEKITLTDPNRPAKPSSIPLAAVRSAEGETGEQGEPAVALMVEAQNGSMRRMVLKFSQWYDKNRWGEREVWVRAIQDILATGSVGQLYRPTGAECAPEINRVPAEGGFSARPPETGGGSLCPQCKSPLPPGSKFCGLCGFSAADYSNYGKKSAKEPGHSSFAGGIIDSESYGGLDESGEEEIFAPSPSRRRAPKKKAGVKKAPRRRSGPIVSENSAAGRIIGFISAPDRAFQATKGQDALDAVAPFIISLLVFAFGSLVFLNWHAKSLNSETYPLLSTFSDFGTAFFFIFELVILLAVFTLIYGVLLHLSVGILGFRSEINDGLRIAMYSATAFIAGGVIPLAGLIIAPFWAFFLQFTGLKETYDLSGAQALIAAAIPAFVFLIVFYVFISSGESGFSIFGGA